MVPTDPGVLEVNWQWLPTWLGVNYVFKAELEKQLRASVVGREMTDDVLDEIHEMIIDHIEARFGKEIDGLRDYLDGLKFVQIKP